MCLSNHLDSCYAKFLLLQGLLLDFDNGNRMISIPDYQNRNVDVVNQLMCNKFSDWCWTPWQEVGFSHICELGNETFKKSDSNCFYHKWQNVTSMGLRQRTNNCDSLQVWRDLIILNKEGDIYWTRKWKMSKDMVIANERYWHYTDLSVT